MEAAIYGNNLAILGSAIYPYPSNLAQKEVFPAVSWQRLAVFRGASLSNRAFPLVNLLVKPQQLTATYGNCPIPQFFRAKRHYDDDEDIDEEAPTGDTDIAATYGGRGVSCYLHVGGSRGGGAYYCYIVTHRRRPTT